MNPRALSLVLLIGCSTTHTHEGPDAMPDASFSEAPHGNVPQLVSLGGKVLAAPKVRPIFFANDTATQKQMEDFLKQLAGSPYWMTAAGEYGVGALTVEPTIVATGTVPTSDAAVQTFLSTNLDGTHPAWGAVDPDVIYSVFLPDGAVLTDPDGTKSCTDYGAYHDEAKGKHGESIPYALIPRCHYPGSTVLDDLTESFSHELLEAATDPRVETTGAFGNVDAEHAIWGLTPGAENGDFCEYNPEAYQKLVGDYMVQRTWSNAAAMAGHDPCVPAIPDAAYAAAAPMLSEQVMLTDGPNGAMATSGVKVAMGTPKTIDVASDFAGDPTMRELTLVFDKTTGHNGDVVHLTITRVKNGAQFGGSEFMIETKVAGKVTAQWWGYAAN